VEIDDFKQNDASSGYVSVKYNLAGGKATLRAKVYDSAKPASEAYFWSSTPEIQPGRGLMLIEIRVEPDSKSPTDLISADTVEVELLENGKVISRVQRRAGMIWARPK
jgi:hypothetical protein